MQANRALPNLNDYDVWIFDLDNTLYRADVNFFGQIDRKITEFISRYLALQPTEARILQKEYLAEYGTSLSGLMAVNGMDPAEFLDYVHDVDLTLLPPNPLLRQSIEALPGRKYIYTNGSRGHAKNIGEHLDLYDLFDGAFGIEDGHYIPKPKPEPYEKFCEVFQIQDPTRAIFFEDNVRNLKVPKDMGMATVLITSDADWSHEPIETRPGHFTDATFIDHVTDDLPQWLSKLFT